MIKTSVRLRLNLGRNLLASVFAVSLVVLSVSAQAQTPGQTLGGDVSSSLKEFMRRLNAKPLDPVAIDEARAFGIELVEASRFQEAAQIFSTLRLVAPDDSSSFYGSALALFNLHRIDEAETLARAAVEKAQAFPPVNKSSAQYDAPGISKTFGNAADALVLLGVVLAVKGDDAGAIAAVSRAVRLAPDNFDAQFALGRALYGAGDPAGATQPFRAAVSLKPADIQARFFLATALERTGDDAAALSAYKELVVVAPGVAEGHLGVGVLLVKRADDGLDEGIRELEKALAINERLYEGQVTLGRALIRQGRIAESLTPLKRAAGLAPDNPEPHYQLVIAYRRLGEKGAAEAESSLVKKIHATRRTSSLSRSDEGLPGRP